MSRTLDWLTRLQEHGADEHAELDLQELRAGDVLRVGTVNTLYTFRMRDDRLAEMITDRPNRPAGPVKIMGCTFGLSTTISPDHLFCGGNLEFTFHRDGMRMTHTTSAIRRLQWVRCAPAASVA